MIRYKLIIENVEVEGELDEQFIRLTPEAKRPEFIARELVPTVVAALQQLRRKYAL